MRLRSVCLAATAVLTLAACDQGDSGPVTLDGLNQAEGPQPYAGPMPTDPQGWATMLSSGDAYLIEAGTLAQSMTATPQVQRFGALMVRYHGQAAAELEAVAGQAGGIAIDPRLSAFEQAQLGKLRSAGAGFDAEFKKQMVTAHQQAIWLLQGFAANGTSPPLQAYAGRHAPAVQGHLAQAYALPGPN
jgi:putative membrane protein